MRTFDSGATRDSDDDKLEYIGFLSPVVLEAFAKYMHRHRKQADGELRASDNWKKGIPREAYMQSLFRHMMDLWHIHEGRRRFDVEGDGHELTIEEVCCAILFNTQGYLFEDLRGVSHPAIFVPDDAYEVIDGVVRLRNVQVPATAGEVACTLPPEARPKDIDEYTPFEIWRMSPSELREVKRVSRRLRGLGGSELWATEEGR